MNRLKDADSRQDIVERSAEAKAEYQSKIDVHINLNVRL